MATGNVLFPEIVDLILYKLRRDVPSLKVASLLCKQWLYVARPYLHKSIVITIFQAQCTTTGDLGSPKDLAIFKSPGYNSKYTTHITLQSSPQIVLQVSPSSPSLSLLLDQFTNLHTLTLSRLHLSRFPVILTADTSFCRITTLRIHRLYYVDPKDITRLILAFPAVLCLSSQPIQEAKTCDSYRRKTQVLPQPRFPSIKCFNIRLDLSPGLSVVLLDLSKWIGCIKRLSTVTALANAFERECLIKTMDYIETQRITTWDLGLNWGVNNRLGRSSLNTLHFDRLISLHILILSLLDLGTTHKHALSYIFIQQILRSFGMYHLTRQVPNLHCFKLSFLSPSASRRDVKRTLGMNTEPGTEARALDLDQTDIQDISLEIKDDGEGYILLANKVQYESPPPTDGGGKGNYSRIDLTNFWSLCDVKLAEVAPACSKLREVVVEVRALEGAKFRDVKNRVQEEIPSSTQDRNGTEYNDEEDQLDLEMGVNELEELVTGLFPDSIGQGLVVRAEIGPVGRISGIWDRHDCSES